MTPKAITIALLFALPVGCQLLRPAGPPRVRYDATKGQADLAAVDVSGIAVLSRDTLPDGFTFQDRGGVSISLYATPGMPSVDDPHRVLGEVRVDLDTRQAREIYLHAMKEEAARHGANALVVLDETGDKCYSRTNYRCRLAVAVHVSSTVAAAFPASKDLLSSWMKIHRDAGKPVDVRTVDLGMPSSFEITPKRGECLTVVLALDKDARITRINNRPALGLRTESRALGFNRTSMIEDDWGTKDRVLALDAGCAQGADPVVVSVRNRMLGDRKPPGSGKAVVQIIEHTVDARALKEQARDLDAAVKRDDAEKAALTREACNSCIGQWRRCVRADPDIERGQCDAFNTCVERRDANPGACFTP